MVKVKTLQGDFVWARALLDSCSTVNLVSKSFANSLKFPKQVCSVNIGAVDGLSTAAQQQVQFPIQSKYNNSVYNLNFLIVPNIADLVPTESFPRDLFDIPKGIRLADPQFHLPKPIDILLDSGTTLSVLSVGQLKLQHGASVIILQKTSLGWIVAGGAMNTTGFNHGLCNVVKLDKLIERFWLIEDFDHEPIKSRDEVACEQHYVTHTKRDQNGRYIVRLPFRDNRFNLGESKQQALRRFQALERKLESNSSLQAEYIKVMEEYISLGHMTLCNETDPYRGYYLPHHAVIKESSDTTKVRVVFDASSKTSTGISLNDTLMVGPTIQNTIFEQILRFRTHQYVITGDIEKMYRQILVHPDDRDFQKTLWYHQGKIRCFRLNTVTFGTAAAPFLAIRTIQQLARDEAYDFPKASKLLLRDFYVDDFISGADSLQEVVEIRDEMTSLLNRGGFIIRKWASNHPHVLDSIDRQSFDLDCLLNEKTVQKSLGIIWDSKNDVLQYSLHQVDPKIVATKRKLLSELSKIFDPLGLLGPVTLFAKVLIQDCWKAKVTWDESLPQDVHTKWRTLANQFVLLKEVTFPRQLLPPVPVQIDLHGFCDACIHGYGACLYIRAVDSNGEVYINLICSKSRVAPLNGLTIPRLELCAASILKRLYLEARAQFDFPIGQVTLWSDSTIVLCWLKKAPHLLRTFEANRVTEIQSLGDQVIWKHIRSEDNPADALSRGQLPSEFIHNPLWRTGPEWFKLSEKDWPKSIEPTITNIPGIKSSICCLALSSCVDMYSRFSSFERFVRVVAYVLRWRTRQTARSHPLSVQEIRQAERRIFAMIQRERFAIELRRLSTAKTSDSAEETVPFRKSTRFDNLHPFIDEEGLIRIGGRLKKADLPYNEKHLILVPGKHPVTDCIIRQYHLANLHAGIQTTLYSLRSKFWIVNGKDQVRKVVRTCIECLRQRPQVIHAQMADLPVARVNESPAFCHTGVDFSGPILIKEKKFRNKSTLKTYGCVFICMASKAVHIELATDLSTEGFLAAFRRFISRRGVPERVYSDNGTNFVGAAKELREIYDLFETPQFRESIGAYAVSKRIEWHFNPPLSPHFGGLWEAAVKSFKHNFRRVVKDQLLTYEQLNTLLIKIEAVLNSRPMCTLSADPNDPLAISPAHLLIGRPFNTLPEKSFLSVPDNRLTTYNFITKARQDFWNKWHKEYLHKLQTRQKWHESTAELKVGSVVILMDDMNSCSRWPLGVIIEVCPGSDGIVRVVKVKTATSVYTRNVTRLCLLPSG